MTDAAFNVEIEISAEPEFVRNATEGVVGSAGGLDGGRIELVNTQARGQLKKAAALIKRALAASDGGDHTAGARLAFKALTLAPDLALANHMMGLMLYRLGRLSKALDFYNRAWKLDPEDGEIYANMGVVAWKLDMLEAAEKFYRIHASKQPGKVNGVINLGGILRDQGKFEPAIEILRQAIYTHPEEHELWNSLGSVLMDQGDPEQARIFYEECLRLAPGSSRALNNLANVCGLLGDVEDAVELYDKALVDPVNDNERATIEHSRAMALLCSARIQEGWDAYQVRLDTANPQATFFVMKSPHWDGADLSQVRGKKLLVVGEQGLGDEILFMNMGHDLIEAIGPDGELLIACEQRLVPLFQRSFPSARVAPHVSSVAEGRNLRAVPDFDGEADYWCAMADPLRSLRGSAEAFPREGRGFLKADPDRQAGFRAQLAAMGSGPKVGLLWKSLKMTAKRKRSFSGFGGWEGVLKTPGVTFVNLQYGDVEEELEIAKREFGVTIHQPEDIDLKLDLDGVAALSSACDLVIGPMNATSNIAAACGAEVWFTHAQRKPWTGLGQSFNPFYPHATSFFGATYRDFAGIFSQVAERLSERTREAA
jgi:Flp pilus assembly protein TadD